MLDNFIRGGQIFLHNVAMFKQVVAKVCLISFILAMCFTWHQYSSKTKNLDAAAGMTYVKAKVTDYIHRHRIVLHQDSSKVVPRIDTFDKYGLFEKRVYTGNIVKHPKFKKAYQDIKAFCLEVIFLTLAVTCALVFIIFLIWVKFGKSASETKIIDGSKVLTATEVSNYLKSNHLDSDILIDGMPLVKDQETRHILVTGMTGAGKTNLINKILPQVRGKKQAALVIDQTGEMISRYYDPARGDVIFNPLDARSCIWDFWGDCTSCLNEFGVNERLEKFAKVLISGARKNSSYSSDPFWENSAEVVFIACVEYLLARANPTIEDLQYILGSWTLKDFKTNLVGTKAARYLENDNSTTASSILSVMTTSCRPLFYLSSAGGSEKLKFSLQGYFQSLAKGSEAWLFLSTPPSQREVILPLLTCCLDIAVSSLVATDIDQQRRVWFIIDELASLGKLNSINTLLTEGRKYGACVLSAVQSYNQILFHYGQYLGSALFGQFATKFIFRCNEPNLVKLMSDSFGSSLYRQHQKNTSYGANTHRDGISYTEHEKEKPLISNNKFMELNDLECFVSMPDPAIKVAKMQLKAVTDVPIKQEGFKPSLEISAKLRHQDEEEVANLGDKNSEKTQSFNKGKDENDLNHESELEKKLHTLSI